MTTAIPITMYYYYRYSYYNILFLLPNTITIAIPIYHILWLSLFIFHIFTFYNRLLTTYVFAIYIVDLPYTSFIEIRTIPIPIRILLPLLSAPSPTPYALNLRP